jgi:hypothetical protein
VLVESILFDPVLANVKVIADLCSPFNGISKVYSSSLLDFLLLSCKNQHLVKHQAVRKVLINHACVLWPRKISSSFVSTFNSLLSSTFLSLVSSLACISKSEFPRESYCIQAWLASPNLSHSEQVFRIACAQSRSYFVPLPQQTSGQSHASVLFLFLKGSSSWCCVECLGF